MNNLTLPKRLKEGTSTHIPKSNPKTPVSSSTPSVDIPTETIFESVEYSQWLDTARDEFDNTFEEYEDFPYVEFDEENGDAYVSTNDGMVRVPNAVVSWIKYQKSIKPKKRSKKKS